MLFSSSIFIFLFLPLVLLLYFVVPRKAKNLLLLIASLFFYAFGEKKFVLLIIVSILVDYSAGIIIDKGKRKLGLWLSLLVNISLLLYFKYAVFMAENLDVLLKRLHFQASFISHIPEITLPLGISFFTFQTMSYTIDVYRGKVKANYNLIDFATYVSLFPQLIAGPIVRYKDIQHQLTNRRQNLLQFSEGIFRFMTGLGKKMIIANNMARIADAAFDAPQQELISTMAWLGIIAYTIQIYFDFSGYSDMAIGLGKMFGFDFPENFNYPYISKSVKEFWRRWHITLSAWFKDYLYISLGGNRKGKMRTYINLFIVFFITGLWHGASWNFIIWGLIHGSFLVVERIGFDKILRSIPDFFSRLYTMSVVLLSWVFFRADTLKDAGYYLGKMFRFDGKNDLNFYSMYLTKEAFIVFLLAIIFSMPVHQIFSRKIKRQEHYHLLKYTFAFVVFVVSVVYISIDAYNPFIYFRF